MTKVSFDKAECSKFQEIKFEGKIDETPNQKEESNQNKESRWQIKPFRGRCFRCNKVGHMKRDCICKTPYKYFFGYVLIPMHMGTRRQNVENLIYQELNKTTSERK